MHHNLLPRTTAEAELRRVTWDSQLLERYALLYALQLLDLHQLNEVLCATSDMAAERLRCHPQQFKHMLEERFGGPSRLS